MSAAAKLLKQKQDEKRLEEEEQKRIEEEELQKELEAERIRVCTLLIMWSYDCAKLVYFIII